MRDINWKDFTIRDYRHMIRRHKWLIIIPFFLTTIGAIVISRITPPVYSTNTTLATGIGRGSVWKGISRLPIPGQELFGMIRQRFLSHTVLMQVAESLQLRDYLERKKGIKIADTGIISTLKKNGIRLGQRLHLIKPKTELTDQQIVRYLRSVIKTKIDSQIIEIQILHSNPQLAMDIANQLASAYVIDARQRRLEEVRATYQFLISQLDTQKMKLEQSEQALREAKEEGLIESLASENIEFIEQLTKAETDLIEIEMSIRDKEREIGQLETPLDISSPEVRQLQSQVDSLEAQLNQLKRKYSDSWPKVRQMQDELEMVRLQLEQAEQQVERQQAEQTKQTRISPKIQRLKKELRQLETKKLEGTIRRDKYREATEKFFPGGYSISHLVSENRQNQQIYDLILSQLEQANFLITTEQQQMGSVAQVLDEAILPESPIKPNKKRIITVGIVVGLGFGLALMFIFEIFNHSIHSIKEAEQCFENIPILGVLPKIDT